VRHFLSILNNSLDWAAEHAAKEFVPQISNICLPEPGTYRNSRVHFFANKFLCRLLEHYACLEANLVFEVANCFAEYLNRPALTAHDESIVPEESALGLDHRGYSIKSAKLSSHLPYSPNLYAMRSLLNFNLFKAKPLSKLRLNLQHRKVDLDHQESSL
jgi:hypothetical protein